MDDIKIIELLFGRADSALEEVSVKYSRLYKGIIREMLSDECDVEECANDLLLALWNSIPPNIPKSLSAYICKLARHIGVDRLRYNTRQKRDTGYTVTLSELDECLPDEALTDENGEKSESIRAILSDFIKKLDAESEVLFVRRYIYLESVASLAERFDMDENYVSVKLYRARKNLKKLLMKEGIRV